MRILYLALLILCPKKYAAIWSICEDESPEIKFICCWTAAEPTGLVFGCLKADNLKISVKDNRLPLRT